MVSSRSKAVRVGKSGVLAGLGLFAAMLLGCGQGKTGGPCEYVELVVEDAIYLGTEEGVSTWDSAAAGRLAFSRIAVPEGLGAGEICELRLEKLVEGSCVPLRFISASRR